MTDVNKAKTEHVKSPCINICCLDEQNICSGCYRSGNEISRWGAMSNDERQQVMIKVIEREQNSGFMMTLKNRK